MARGYDKEFLIDVYMSPYIRAGIVSIEVLCDLEENAAKFYEKHGKEKFRTYASVDAEAIRNYKNDNS